MTKAKIAKQPKAKRSASALKSQKTTADGQKRLKLQQSVDRPSPGPRADTKLGSMIALLRRREGATIEQMMKATGWQAHSVRGAMSGALKKRLGLTITSIEADGSRTYRIAKTDNA